MRPDRNSEELQPGQVFEGKYTIQRELGRGGFGMVYLAFQEGLDRHVALKVLRSAVTQTAPSAKERFLREVKIISKLKHPNTVTIHDFGETYEGSLYMVLEYVEGETLKQVLKREGAQDVLRACDLARQIARSLAEAHRHGIVHRDLKPANVMVTSLDSDRDFVKVLDFGVARLLDSPTDDLTSVGLPEGERELIGTPRYMSPEQVRGESLTGASDIYGLGLIFYEMLSGMPAVQGDTTMGLITQQISPEPLSLPMSSSVEPFVADVIRIATAKSLADRFQAAEQMADALEQAIFQIRRNRNLTGQTPEGIALSGYHPQLDQFQPSWSAAPDNSGFNAGLQPSGYDSSPSMQLTSTAYGNSGLTPGPGFDLSALEPPNSSQQFDAHSGWNQQYDPFEQRAPFATAGGFLGVPDAPPVQPAQPAQPVRPTGPQVPIPSGPHLRPQQVSQQISSPFVGPGPEDFGATVERDALDPNQLISRPQSLFERNQHPSAEMPVAVDDPDLPPVPVDVKPFQSGLNAAPAGVQAGPQTGGLPVMPTPPKKKFWQRGNKADKPAPQEVELPSRAVMAARQRGQVREETLSQFAISVVKACVFATLAAACTYFTFLIVGAALETLTGGSSRVLATFAVALALPILAFSNEFGRSGRFLPDSLAERFARALMHTAVFALGVILVTAGACANDVVPQLREEPNWFLEEPDGRGFPSFNARTSTALSSFIGDTFHAIGLYDPKASIDVPRAPALPSSTRKGNEQRKPTAPTDDARELRDSKDPTRTHEKW